MLPFTLNGPILLLPQTGMSSAFNHQLILAIARTIVLMVKLLCIIGFIIFLFVVALQTNIVMGYLGNQSHILLS